ncbi:alpha/beta fold hydrolase [Methylomonas sp. SURF-2]|uniref:Alpha/beta fold hydrolase n=1 Tax=Methylomonas subterranea TaxID=2952225 RepID=A0ABT1TJD2_9GAMM|nr:alpha/beta fold hydrolase [Methylomonas sp. SURF-2]MCQ8105316.1 alpha/beta fold hydrolase [Methylomonas sp. SURF-2]
MNAVDLAFETHGDENNSPLIILHGFLASSRNWRGIAKRLAEHHFVYVLDMRNHGGSPHDEQMDYPLMAYDVICFMDKMGIGSAHLLGHSMGGKIAMWIALHYPERIKQLVVVDIAPVNYEHSFAPMIYALRQLPLDRISNRKDAEQFLATAIPDMGFRQFLLQNLLLKDSAYFWRINLDYIDRCAHHIVAFPQPENQAFNNTALFVAGERSTYIEPTAVIKFFPSAEFVEIADTGHWLYVEAPDQFCRLVAEWLARS